MTFMEKVLGHLPSALTKGERQERIAMWVAMIVGIVLSGLAFAYKVAEFLFTLSAKEVQGFADVPVAVYFMVAAGWLLLLVWSFVSGQFADPERSKYDMLAQEEEYERRGE